MGNCVHFIFFVLPFFEMVGAFNFDSCTSTKGIHQASGHAMKEVAEKAKPEDDNDNNDNNNNNNNRQQMSRASKTAMRLVGKEGTKMGSCLRSLMPVHSRTPPSALQAHPKTLGRGLR